MTKETIEEEVDRTIAESIEYNGESLGYFGFFNNFDANLPGGRRTKRELLPEGYLDRRFYENDSRASERLKEQTQREFNEEVRTAVISAGLDPKELMKERRDQINRNNRLNDDFYRKLIPIYIILRKRGYNHSDLVC
jgi:hypothetical protein